MAQRHRAPEVAPQDLESPSGKAYGGGQMIPMGGGAPHGIQPYQASGGGAGESKNHGRGGSSRSIDSEGMKKVAAACGGIWLLGCFLGYDYLWPLYLVFDILSYVLSIPPFSWLFGWISTPLSWIFGYAYKGAPIVQQQGALQELRLPTDQVNTYLDSYVNQYGDAALIFATHDGYPQLVNALLQNRDLGYKDLVDATDDNGNTALIYAAAKGYRQSTAALLRSGADPDIPNQGGGGRTPLMEAAGAGHKDIVSAIRLSNATVDSVDDFGNTALHYAGYHGHLSSVHELLKGNPRKDIQNSYGHTAASYAASNKHKAIADLLSRAPSKRERALQEQLEGKQQAKETAAADDFEGMADLEDPEDEKPAPARKHKKGEAPKHVKGAAEDLHTQEEEDFAPKVEKQVSGMTDSERKHLEEQIAKLKRHHEDAELKAQKRIVELLEKSSKHQQAIDSAERDARAWQLNTTELTMRAQELESKHRSSELKAQDEQERADKLHEDMLEARREAERHKSRVEGAERERDLHRDAAKRHEERLKQKHEEVKDHFERLQKHQEETSRLRGTVQQREEEVRRHKEEISRLQRELSLVRGQGVSGSGGGAPVAELSSVAATAPPTEAPVVVPPPPAPPAEAVEAKVEPHSAASAAASQEQQAAPPSSEGTSAGSGDLQPEVPVSNADGAATEASAGGVPADAPPAPPVDQKAADAAQS
eukprot:CAMPEP_0115121194 /NCGR_PEP_ID=MMETSP0227-20121206/46114_1 /TAXON_ID=89957 /ORGANISM="Polarella glacialis, Strain CCMP 1383" /LENGTH=706 /DNA_ID=CAMNT_0002522953 /DNA_START=78 /DNA_END=2198 /DNA_ORIENTATION=+